MAVSANSYGTSADVAALTPRYSNGAGDFDEATKPTQARVEGYIDNVSAMANGCLSQMGFSIPVSSSSAPDVVLILKQLVTETVAVIVEGINGTGRYAPTAKQIQARGLNNAIYQDVCDFLNGMAFGLEAMGADKSSDEAESIGFRQFDQSGNEIFPIFQRKAFGNRFDKWDS